VPPVTDEKSAVEKRLAGIRRDAHDDPVGQHACAARHRRKVAARLANHGRGFARNRRFVDGCDAVDHFAVGGNHVAGFDQHHVAAAQVRGRDNADRRLRMRLVELFRHHVFLRAAKRRGLRFRAAFREGFGEVREQHREPQPQRDRENETRGRLGLAGERGDPENRRQNTAHVHAEHHRVAELRARRELPE